MSLMAHFTSGSNMLQLEIKFVKTQVMDDQVRKKIKVVINIFCGTGVKKSFNQNINVAFQKKIKTNKLPFLKAA